MTGILSVEVTNILVLENKDYHDNIYIETSLPSPFPADVTLNSLILKFNTPKGTALEFIKSNFTFDNDISIRIKHPTGKIQDLTIKKSIHIRED